MNLNIADFHKELNRMSKNENAVRDDQGGVILSEATDVLNKLVTMIFNDIERSKNNVSALIDMQDSMDMDTEMNQIETYENFIQNNCEFRRINESILRELMLMMKGDEQ